MSLLQKWRERASQARELSRLLVLGAGGFADGIERVSGAFIAKLRQHGVSGELGRNFERLLKGAREKMPDAPPEEVQSLALFEFSVDIFSSLLEELKSEGQRMREMAIGKDSEADALENSAAELEAEEDGAREHLNGHGNVRPDQSS